jgi:DUF4097 and DUF4098 domain-containing protein YvlB
MPSYNRETTVHLDAGSRPEIRISSISGNIHVRGEDRGNVLVTARAQFDATSEGDADEMLAELTRHIRAEQGRVEITAPSGRRHGGFRWGRGGFRWAMAAALELGESHSRIDYEIAAPVGYGIETKLLHGDVSIRDAGRGVNLHLVNGSCNVEDSGDVHATLVNGSATVLRASADVDLKLTNGRLLLTDIQGDLNLNLVHGNIEVLNPGGAVNGQCVSGRMVLTGVVRSDVSLHTAHGSIVLTVPADSRFQLDAWSGLGSVTSELEVRDSAPGGGTAPSVSLRTETGSIELRRLRDREPAAASL